MKNKKWIAFLFFTVFLLTGCRSAQPIPDSSGKEVKPSQETGVLPVFYDGRKEGRVPPVKNQGTLGTCWAFASLQALEASLLPEESYDFSEDHMSLGNGFSIPQEEGGEFTMSLAYLLSWKGPVLESDDPYGDGISPVGLKAVKHVQEVQLIPGKDYEKIKRAVLQYGGVQSSLYTSMTDENSRSSSYNEEAYAYCYIGSQPPNHDSVIIGWDDAYPKENFHEDVNGDGAFICLNSWGKGFGDQGYYYVSYYDSNIGMNNLVYAAAEEPNNYDHIYQSDLRGWVGQLGYGEDTVWMSNVYEAENNETLSAVGFYATASRTTYEIYAVPAAKDREAIINGGDFDRRIRLAEGSFQNAGFYTVALPEGAGKAVELKKGERFAVVVKITTPDTVHPAAIEYDAGDGRTFADLSDGEGYISADGGNWESVEEKQNCNLCLKAYTKDR
ncbi:lectin like domain-containing protein [Lacrimispora sp. JR3]|uniref:lectin like domain-containing protein n=1 Tax=Lacrimispora sinapis TaxID=3111456 RepID=UPI003747A89D